MIAALTTLASTAVILSKDAQRALVEASQAGDAQALTELIQSNSRLAHKVAKRYANGSISFEDLLSVCTEAIIYAAGKYDLTSDASFTTYARLWMVAKCQNHVQANAGMLHCGSRTAKTLWAQLAKTRAVIGDDATPAQIAEHLGLDADDVAVTMAAMTDRGASMDKPLNDEGLTVATFIADDADTQDVTMDRARFSQAIQKQITNFINTLPERDAAIFQARILADYHGVDKAPADSFGVTKQRVGQIERKLTYRFQSFLANRVGTEVLVEALETN